MKTTIRVFVLLLLVFSIGGLHSCSSKNETTGSLTVTVMDHQGVAMPNEPISLATSLANLDNNIFVVTKVTDANGAIQFRELAPQYYWFKTEHFKGIGASKVFATQDTFVLLFVEPM